MLQYYVIIAGKMNQERNRFNIYAFNVWVKQGWIHYVELEI